MHILFVADVGLEKVVGGAERVLDAYVTMCRHRGHRVSALSFHTYESYRLAREKRPWEKLAYFIRRSAMFLFSCRRLMQECRPDVINCHQPLSGLLMLLCPGIRKIPKTYCFHSSGAEEYATRLLRSGKGAKGFSLWDRWNIAIRRWMEYFPLKSSKCIIVLSQYSSEILSRLHKIPPPQVNLIPGGVDTEQFRPSSERLQTRQVLAPGSSCLLFTVRNLVPRMGLENLVHAMVDIARDHPGVMLIIGGEGPLRPHLSEQIRSLDLERNVRLEGFIPESRLAGYYQAADLFVLPTRMLEGFGLVAVEALACGTPVVGTPIGGILEVLGKLDKMLLCDGTEAHHIASRIKYFLDHPEELSRIREKCRPYAVEHYSWEKVIERLEEVLAGAARKEM